MGSFEFRGVREEKGLAEASPVQNECCGAGLDLVVHVAAHAAVGRAAGWFLIFLGDLGDERLGGEEKPGDGSCVLEGSAGDLFGVDDAGFDEVFVVAGADVIAFVAFAAFDFLDDDGAFDAGVFGQGAGWELDGPFDDIDADAFVIVGGLDGVHGADATEERDAAAGDDAFFDGSASGVECVFDAGFTFLHFGFGCSAHVDDGDAAGEFSEAFLEFFAVVVGGGFLDLAADLIDAALDFGGFAVAFDDGGILLIDDDGLSAAEVLEAEVFEFDTEVFGDAAAAGEDSDILEHGFATIAEAWGFDGAAVEGAAEFIDDEGGEGFAFDLFGDDEEGFTAFGDFLEDGEEILEVTDFFLVDEDVSLFEFSLHVFGIGDEVRGEIALIELHAFDHFEGGFDGFGFFDGDGAILADFIHGIGDDFADGGIPVGGDGGDLFDFVLVLDLFGDFVEVNDGGFDGFSDAALDADGVGAGGHVFEAFAEDGFGEDGGGGGAIAGGVARFAGDFADHLSAHILEGIFEFDFLGDGDTVFGDGGRPEFFVEDDVTAFGAECCGDGFREFIDAAEQGMPGRLVEDKLFCCHSGSWLGEGLRDDGEEIVGAHEFILLAVEFDFSSAVFTDEDAIAHFDFKGDFFAVIVVFSGAERADDAFGWFFLGGIGYDDAAFFSFLLFDRFHEDPVAERFQIDCHRVYYSLVRLMMYQSNPAALAAGKL
jgi:hypothetical protein